MTILMTGGDRIPWAAEPDHTCPTCGNDMEWADCWMFDCEEGTYDLYEEDPIFYEPGDRAGCEECGGKGGWWYCSACEKSAQQRGDSGV